MPRNLMNYERAHACWRVATVVKHLPAAYQAFYNEWRIEQPKPVHYRAETGNWKKDPKTGQIVRVENVPIPLLYPREHATGLWGGEAVIKGYVNRGRNAARIPQWWVPRLQRTVLYSEVLDRQLQLLATQRAVQLVHDHYGLDGYLLQNRACDISSLLGLKIKREILLALARGTLRPDDPALRQRLLDRYKDHIIPEADAEWYGLTVSEAVRRQHELRRAAGPPPPLKQQLRAELLQRLRQLQLEEATTAAARSEESGAGSWFNKINPFASGSSAEKR